MSYNRKYFQHLFGDASPKKFELARSFKQEMTSAEDVLWQHLRGKKLMGLKFRREHPFDNFILDFYCPQFKLAIEVDGAIHNDVGQQQYDNSRTEKLKLNGITVIRFTNEEVLRDIEFVKIRIVEKMQLLSGS